MPDHNRNHATDGQPERLIGEPAPPSIFVISDVRLFRQGIAGILGGSSWLRVVGNGGARDVEAAVLLQPHVVMVDCGLVKSESLVTRLRTGLPGAKLVAFAVSENGHDPIACAEAGFSSYVHCEATAEELVAVIAASLRGEAVYAPHVTARLFAHIGSMAGSRPLAAEVLTRRELQVLPLLGQGLSNKEIARALQVETATVKNHIHNILEKLHLHRRAEVAALVARDHPSLRKPR